MRKTLFLLFCLLSFAVKGQDTVRIRHTNYTTVFSKSKRYPVLVEWWATRAKVGCKNPLPRTDKFRPDPSLPKETDLAEDYKGSGLDRGHMSPAADNQCQTPRVQDECFYFSNMAAQYHSLNAGDWKALEVLTRTIAIEKDSVHVWAGNVGVAKKIGRVSVPTQCWKVIYVVKDKKYSAYLFNNTSNKPQGLSVNQVSINQVQKLTGFKFK